MPTAGGYVETLQPGVIGSIRSVTISTEAVDKHVRNDLRTPEESRISWILQHSPKK
jgi:hypothetical protein